jgi:hypothetical protein
LWRCETLHQPSPTTAKENEYYTDSPYPPVADDFVEAGDACHHEARIVRRERRARGVRVQVDVDERAQARRFRERDCEYRLRSQN